MTLGDKLERVCCRVVLLHERECDRRALELYVPEPRRGHLIRGRGRWESRVTGNTITGEVET